MYMLVRIRDVPELQNVRMLRYHLHELARLLQPSVDDEERGRGSITHE